MITVSYNPDLNRFVFESLPWQNIDISLFADVVIEEIQPACESDSSTGYASDGITAYIVTGTPAQAEEVCKKLKELAPVKKQVVIGSETALF